MYFFALHVFYCVCIIAEAVPDEEQAPSDKQQEDSDIVELILQLEDEQRQRQHDRGFLSAYVNITKHVLCFLYPNFYRR